MKKTKISPKLRFSEFIDNWQEVKFDEIYHFKTTNSYSREKLNYNSGEVKNIHYGDIHTKFHTLFDITKEETPFINKDIQLHKISFENYCIEGDIILADASEDMKDVGKTIEIINTNGEKLLSGLHTILARPDLNYFEIGFAGYLFKSNNIRIQIQRESQGSKVLSISPKRLSTIKLSFPSKDEQKKIINFFVAIDNKLNYLKRKLTLLKQYKKGLLQKIFSQELRFKDDNGKEFPKWERRKLGEVCKMQSGKFINANEIININHSDSFPCYGGNGLRGYTMRYNQNGDYPLIGRQGAHCGNITFAKGKFYATEHAIIVFEKIPFNPKWMYYLLSTLNLNQYSTGLAQPGLSIQTIERVDIFFSNIINEQTKIANFLSAIAEKINHTEAQIQKTGEWKKGLLQNMFV